MLEKKDIMISALYPAAVMDDLFPHRIRHKILHIAGNAAFLFGISAAVLYLLPLFPADGSFLSADLTAALFGFAPRAFGAALIAFSIWSPVFLLEMFFLSYLTNGEGKAPARFSLNTLKALRRMKDGDITRSFLLSHPGEIVMARCGITKKEIKEFSASMAGGSPAALLPELPEVAGVAFTVANLALFLWNTDAQFQSFLFSAGVGKDDLVGAARWLEYRSEVWKYREAWWRKEHLMQISPLGGDWAFGATYRLDRYGTEVAASPALPESPLYHKTLEELARALSRDRNANALLVGVFGSDGAGVMQDFANIISGGEHPVLGRKRIVLLDAELLVSSTGDRTAFERETLAILEEASSAGNVILAIPNLPALLENAKQMGVDLVTLLEPYLLSPELQVVAMSGENEFHRVIEGNTVLITRFERVAVEPIEEGALLRALEDEIVAFERKYGVFYTYQAVRAATESAREYFIGAETLGKALGILEESAIFAQRKKKYFVEKEDVLELVGAKTGIPVGRITEEEKGTLLQLERILHERVVGQDEAVGLIASAMRRARAGVRSTKRPIGSFLFIGPTGVGKTETAKALAEVFFGDEEKIVRFDMSEYQTPDALSRLIGGMGESAIGTLSTALRKKPYGVVLLDEFEKTNPNVHDLFLQILDEGMFSDAQGRRVNARNILFIATSNAGSELIWEAVKKGENIPKMKDEIIGEIIREGKFKPELLNRFDGVVLFHPLAPEHLKKIAALMLAGLKKRLRERGIDLVVNNLLVEYVAREGYDPVFGARPMKRVIQEKIEQAVAEKLISGELRAGSSVEFAERDFL